MSVSGTFVQGGAGRVLVVSHEPDGPCRSTVLVVPAFGEEMNKARRLVSETGRALAGRGVRTIVPDLFGTGDSEGEFADARWEIWIEDLRRTLEWARGRGAVGFGALLVRLGAGLFSDAFAQADVEFDSVVAWQPVARGEDVLRQLLRMKTMAARMAGAKAEPAEQLLKTLLAGPEPLELGGYLVAPALAAALQRSAFVAGPGARGVVIELDPAAPVDANGALAAPAIASELGASWTTRKVAGERFWTAVEPRANPALVAATAQLLAAS